MMFNPMQMIANMMNPQQILNRFLQGVPAEIRNNPDQVLSWMRQNGMVSERTPGRWPTCSRCSSCRVS